MFEKITKQQLIDSVAKRFKKTYYVNNKWYGNSRQIFSKLISKKPKTEKEVCDIIGNNSWTTLQCYNCGKDFNQVIKFTNLCDKDNYFYICKDCLQKAISELD